MNPMKFKQYIFIVLCIGGKVHAQELLQELDQLTPSLQYEQVAFMSSRISIGHSVQTLKKGVLEIGTRSLFWNLPNNNSQSFVADKMSTRFSLEYGVNNRLTFGGGGTSLDGIFDTFFKYKLISQRKKGSPISLTLFQNATYRSGRPSSLDLHRTDFFEDKLAFTTQMLVASKISSRFSVQISPTFVHRTSSIARDNPDNQWAMGLGGRYKLGRHVSLVSEYYHQFTPIKLQDTYGAFALGVNWELSDIMLQFQMTNIRNLAEDAFITRTFNNFNTNDGNFVFGFTGIFILHFRNELKN